MNRLAIPAVLLTASSVVADHAMLIEVSNPVSPDQPSATVTVLAAFDADLYAFAGGMFEMFAGEWGFSDPQRLLKGPGTYDGWVSPDGTEVTGIITGQLHFPDAGIFADPANPIPIWQATWTTDDFSPRKVDLWSGKPLRWDVYLDSSGVAKDFSDVVSIAGGTITVIPAPWAWPAVMGVVLYGRRRRGR